MTAPSFGATLKAMRELRRPPVSQSMLAERAGFDHSYVSRLESCGRKPTKDAVERIGKALLLDDAQRDELRAAAGFLPNDLNSLLIDEPIVCDVRNLLQDEGLSEEVRANLRNVLYGIIHGTRLMQGAPSESSEAAA